MHNHDIKTPTILPKAKKFKVIKTKMGKTGKIDSTTIKRHPNKGPQTPKFSIKIFMISVAKPNNLCYNVFVESWISAGI